MNLSCIDDLIATSLDSRYLELILLSTEACNFRCNYCYEDFKHGKMQREVVESIKLLLSNWADDLQSLHLSWFGGEPLLAKDLVLELNGYAKDIYTSERYYSSITTNGYLLTEELFEALLQVGIFYFQVSLDGSKTYHDRSRVTVRGRGTFEVIWSNLLATRKSARDFLLTFRVHVTPENFDDVLMFVEDILKEFGGDHRYKIFIKEIVRLGSPNDEKIVPLAKGKMSELIALIQNKSSGALKIECDSDNDVHVCYASRLNSFLIRSDGRIGKCTVALNDDENVVGILKDNGKLAIDRLKLMRWTAGLFTKNEEQLGCPLAFKNRHH